nr:glycine--tRNA ligase subunit beta [uncultured Rhodoferax sp.]
MTSKNLLVELFVEELPPKALKKLGEAFATQIWLKLADQALVDSAKTFNSDVCVAYASPRRLAVWIKDVFGQAADKAVSQKLMPVAVGLDAAGNATPALLKKLQALGADASAVTGLKRAPDGKAEALFYDSTVKGATLAEGLQKALLDAIAKLPIPKVMTYQLESGCELPGWSSVSFVRPAHSLMALHGADVVPVQALGLHSGNSTQGHRFEAAVSPVVIPDADAYAAVLAMDGAVIASFADRRAEIVRQLAAAAAKVGGGCKPIDDDALLDEVTALVERPNVLICEFETQFLDVPQECLILTMKANQKYFPLLDANNKLTNKFLVVSNINPEDTSFVIGGNERVVRPRLADAKFFFDQDRKKTLASRVEGLGKVVYHNKLGTQGERVERVRAIAKAIAAQLGDATLVAQADQAAQLAKTDLVTDMVGEFPELQGIMGGYYALNDGLSETVAHAIEDHYKPRFAGDELPRDRVGAIVALADKLETLVGMFGIGNLPTGDKDPFALRRHALGVIAIAEQLSLADYLDETGSSQIDVLGWLSIAAGSFQKQMFEPTVADAVYTFMLERQYNSLTPIYGHAAVSAVLELRPSLVDVGKRIQAVKAFEKLPEAPALAAANKRVGNILKKVEGEVPTAINPALLVESAEKELADALKTVAPAADAAWTAGNYAANLQALAALKAPVDAFFDGVMVNAEDPALKANRLGLLATLHAAMNRVADLSKLAA